MDMIVASVIVIVMVTGVGVVIASQRTVRYRDDNLV